MFLKIYDIRLNVIINILYILICIFLKIFFFNLTVQCSHIVIKCITNK